MSDGVKVMIVVVIIFGSMIGTGIYLDATNYNEKRRQERIDKAKIVTGKVERLSYQGSGTGTTQTTAIHLIDGRSIIVKNYQRNLRENETYKFWIDENPHYDCYDLLKYEKR